MSCRIDLKLSWKMSWRPWRIQWTNLKRRSPRRKQTTSYRHPAHPSHGCIHSQSKWVMQF